MVQPNKVAETSSAKEAEVRKNEIVDLVYEHNTPMHCKRCGSAAAYIHSEQWSDGFYYADYSCPTCGYSEVYE